MPHSLPAKPLISVIQLITLCVIGVVAPTVIPATAQARPTTAPTSPHVPLPTAVTDTATMPDTCPKHAQGQRIASIHYVGLDLTQPFVVDRARFQKVGHDFSCKRYRLEQTRMQGLDIFSTIRITTKSVPSQVCQIGQIEKTTTRTATLNLTYHFIELPQYLIYPAVRRSDLYGWLVGPAVSFLNFLGRDIRLETFLRTAISPKPFVATELLLEASSPWMGRDVPIEYTLGVLRTEAFNGIKQFNETSWNLNLSLYHRMTWRFRLIYAVEFIQVSPDPANPTFKVDSNPKPVPILLDPSGDMVLGLAGGLMWDSRDRWVNPHEGMWLEARVGQYGGLLGGPAAYQLYLLDHRSWWHVRWTAEQLTILHLSGLMRLRPGQMGVYDYYVLGGPNSLRTFTQNSELYAQSEVLGTAELRHELFDRRPISIFGLHMYAGLQLILGGDVALLWRPQDTFPDAPRTYGAVYGGIHILLPGVDRLRFELGWHRDAAGRWRSGFSVGLFEKSTVQRWRQR